MKPWRRPSPTEGCSASKEEEEENTKKKKRRRRRRKNNNKKTFLISERYGDNWPASRPGRCNPGETAADTVGEETGWAPEPVWSLWRI
jgi:hypothetical protein